MRIKRSKQTGPDGLEEEHWHYEKKSIESLIDQIRVLFGVVMATHLLFYGVFYIIPLFFAWYFGILSSFTIWTMVGIYLTSYLFHTPHLKAKGAYWKWFKHHDLWEWALYRYDWLTIRRGKVPEPNRPLMFCVQPHGIYCGNRVQFMGKTFFREIYPNNFGRFAAATPHFYTPGMRETSVMCGAVDAGKSTVTKVLASKESLYLWVGGSRELLTTDPDTSETQLVITDRKGFVKLAIETGTDIVPVMQFGEKFGLKKFTFSGRLKKLLYAIKIPLILFHGEYGTLVPYAKRSSGKDIRMGMVFDVPIPVKKQEPATPEYMDEIHKLYMSRMKFMFETYKHLYNYENEQTMQMISSDDVKLI